jgi:serine/threonine protein kinase
MQNKEVPPIICSEIKRIDEHYDLKNDKEDVRYMVYQKIIGKGNFGLVMKGVHKSTNIFRAIKVIKKSKLPVPENLKNQLEFMKTFQHPNLAQLYEFFEDKRYIYLVIE